MRVPTPACATRSTQPAGRPKRCAQRASAFPAGTLVINIAGSFLLGFIIRLATGSAVIAPELRGGQDQQELHRIEELEPG